MDAAYGASSTLGREVEETLERKIARIALWTNQGKAAFDFLHRGRFNHPLNDVAFVSFMCLLYFLSRCR